MIFNGQTAKDYGLREAIIAHAFAQYAFAVQAHMDSDKMANRYKEDDLSEYFVLNGRVYLRMSPDLKEHLFSYLTDKQLRSSLNSAYKKGLIDRKKLKDYDTSVKGAAMDQTYYYSAN